MNERNATIDIFGTKIGNAEEYDCDDDMNVNYVNCEFDDFFLQDNRLEKLKNFLNEKKEGDFICFSFGLHKKEALLYFYDKEGELYFEITLDFVEIIKSIL